MAQKAFAQARANLCTALWCVSSLATAHKAFERHCGVSCCTRAVISMMSASERPSSGFAQERFLADRVGANLAMPQRALESSWGPSCFNIVGVFFTMLATYLTAVLTSGLCTSSFPRDHRSLATIEGQRTRGSGCRQVKTSSSTPSSPDASFCAAMYSTVTASSASSVIKLPSCSSSPCPAVASSLASSSSTLPPSRSASPGPLTATSLEPCGGRPPPSSPVVAAEGSAAVAEGSAVSPHMAAIAGSSAWKSQVEVHQLPSGLTIVGMPPYHHCAAAACCSR
mmetsp:Transcript_14418/g.34030  ORF Transcript_14418/g.34030 Transcript_14418/m.34030 type:complete len:282 (-) Transcript_14418:596-1441(-)